MGRGQATRGCRLVAALLLAQGCVFSVDARIFRPQHDAGGADDDAAAQDEGESPSDDAGDPWDAQEPESEAGDDAGTTEPDACPPEGCPPPCGEDSECSAEQYCSRASGGCAARCEDGLGCVSERAHDVQSMLGDGQTLYWSTRSDAFDLMGERMPNASIWSWDLQGEAVTVLSGAMEPTLRFVADGYLYYTERAAGTFLQWPFVRWDVWRVSLSPSASPEAVAEGVSNVWKTEGFIYWCMISGVPTPELWRKPRAGAGAAQRLSAGHHAGWYGGNDEFAFHLEQQNSRLTVFADQLSDLTVTREIVGAEPGLLPLDALIVVGSMLYFSVPAEGVIYGVDSAAQGAPQALTPPWGVYVNFFENAGWLYWSVSTDWEPGTWDIVYGSNRAAMSPIQLRRSVRSASLPASDTLFSVVGQQIVYWNQAEERFFTSPLPPLSCSDTSPCPSGQSCTAAMLCQ